MRIFVKTVGRGMFFARVEGEPWGIGPSLQPLLDAARIALDFGRGADEVIEMWHEGASECALWSTIGNAARLTVADRPSGSAPKFEPWKQFGLDRE